MTTKLNKIFDLLNKLSREFEEAFVNHSNDSGKEIQRIINIYVEFQDIFPLKIKDLLDTLHLQNGEALESTIWEKLKEIYFNLEKYIKLDYQYAAHYDVTEAYLLLNLFSDSKKLCRNYFFALSKFYYFQYGKKLPREEFPINVNFLEYYSKNPREFSDVSKEEAITKLRNQYDYEYDLLEREVMYYYTRNNFKLIITNPEDTDATKKDWLSEINEEYYSKIKILEQYRSNITKLSSNISFDYPQAINVAENTIIKFHHPEAVFESLQTFLSVSAFEAPLKRLLRGDISCHPPGINLNLSSGEIGTIFKYFFIINEIPNDTPKNELINWIASNFLYSKKGGHRRVQPEGIRKQLQNHLPVTENELPRDFKFTSPT